MGPAGNLRELSGRKVYADGFRRHGGKISTTTGLQKTCGWVAVVGMVSRTLNVGGARFLPIGFP